MPQFQLIPGIPSFGEQLGQGLGQGFGTGLSQGIGNAINNMFEQRKIASAEKDFINRGLPPALARLAAVAPVGGQTEIFKAALDEFKRSGRPLMQSLGGAQEQQVSPEIAEAAGEQMEAPETPRMQPKAQVDADLGLTPSERAKRESERYKTGLPIYQETTQKLKVLRDDEDRFKVLQQLNESGKLPKNLERLNVDKEGNLKFPYGATPEAQRFVKTLNEFSAGAKDTFGSRVTNFDLQQYLLRYPTLLNTEEGRRQLIQQMKIVNQINTAYYGALKKAYNEAGGIRKIDADEAERRAEQMSAPVIDKLRQRFDQIGSFESKPAAAQFKGKKIRDKETGEVFVSDGQNWVPEK